MTDPLQRLRRLLRDSYRQACLYAHACLPHCRYTKKKQLASLHYRVNILLLKDKTLDRNVIERALATAYDILYPIDSGSTAQLDYALRDVSYRLTLQDIAIPDAPVTPAWNIPFHRSDLNSINLVTRICVSGAYYGLLLDYSLQHAPVPTIFQRSLLQLHPDWIVVYPHGFHQDVVDTLHPGLYAAAISIATLYDTPAQRGIALRAWRQLPAIPATTLPGDLC